jgi:uncharacterized metal-binding protein YceD (DUF177 family)
MEFSRPVEIDNLPSGGAVHEIAAQPAERAALADRFALLALERLEARVRLTPLAGGLVRLDAELGADVVQECVITLEPIATHVEDHFSLLYGPAEQVGREIVLSDETELVEPLADGFIDIGETVAQQLSLALDPFPRAPGAEVPPEPPGDAPPTSPFAALAKWKKRG